MRRGGSLGPGECVCVGEECVRARVCVCVGGGGGRGVPRQRIWASSISRQQQRAQTRWGQRECMSAWCGDLEGHLAFQHNPR